MRHLRAVASPSQRVTTNDTARRVCLMHETARVAEHTPLATTPLGRLTELVENTSKAVTAIGDDNARDLRSVLLALNVQTQLWLSEIDRGDAA